MPAPPTKRGQESTDHEIVSHFGSESHRIRVRCSCGWESGEHFDAARAKAEHAEHCSESTDQQERCICASLTFASGGPGGGYCPVHGAVTTTGEAHANAKLASTEERLRLAIIDRESADQDLRHQIERTREAEERARGWETKAREYGYPDGNVPILRAHRDSLLAGQIERVLTILAEEECLPYTARVRDYLPENRPYPQDSPEWRAFKEAEADAERQNRDFAQRIVEAVLERKTDQSRSILDSGERGACPYCVAFQSRDWATVEEMQNTGQGCTCVSTPDPEHP